MATEMADAAVGAQVFEIPAENWEPLKREIEKLSKRAAKLGCPPIELKQTTISNVTKVTKKG